MSATDVIVIVIVVVVVAVLAALAVRVMQRRKLRDRFGDEYQRVVDEKGGRSAAEAELRRREKQHATLDLRDLSDADRVRFREGWVAVQTLFVDDPVAAVRDGDRLVTDLVAARGYPVSDYEDRLAQLSVEHANVLSHYRDAHAISTRNDAGKATTEELRQALVHYRELFADLLGERPVAESPTNTGSSSNTRSSSNTGSSSSTGAAAAEAAEPSEPVAGTPVAPVAGAPVTNHGDAARASDESVNGAPVADSMRSGARTKAANRDASAVDSDADEA